MKIRGESGAVPARSSSLGGAVRITQGKNKAQQKYKSAKEKDVKATSDVLQNKLRTRNSAGDAGIKKNLKESIKVMKKTSKEVKAKSTPSSKMKDAPRNAKKAGM